MPPSVASPTLAACACLSALLTAAAASTAKTPAPKASAAVCEAAAGSRCWYVSPDAGPSAAGSLASPFRQPQQAVHAAKAGDVIYLRGGVYTAAHAPAPRPGHPRRILSIGEAHTAAGRRSTASGTADKPITIKAYPGESPRFTDAGSVSIGSLTTETCHWILEGLSIEGGNVHLWGGSRGAGGKPVAQTHHITLRRNEIFDHGERDGENAGLIKIDRGDWGGPAHILIEENRLHDLHGTGCSGCRQPPGRYDWKTNADFQHFGAITTLSCESYVDPACGGNGPLTIRRNTIYNVPMVFFFKNPTRGPVIIEDNVMHHAQTLGRIAASNVRFEGNLSTHIPQGLLVGGFGGSMAPALHAISGRNFTLVRNTFVGMDAVVRFTEDGSHHTVRRNVVFGLSQRVSAANFDTPGFLSRYLSDAEYSDRGPDLSASELGEGTVVDGNCLIGPHPDLIAVSRYLPRTGPGRRWGLSFLTLDESRRKFGFEKAGRTLIRSNDAAGLQSVFVDPSQGNFALREGSGCPEAGAFSPP